MTHGAAGLPRTSDAECVDFLQWALPRLQLRWAGFRKVRRQVCKRVARRRREFGLPDLATYRSYLEAHPREWEVLDDLCRITISRFYRDRAVFGVLGDEVLPCLARSGGRGRLAAWSAGCASGEEPYTLALIWAFTVAPAFPGVELEITATDVDQTMIERARTACYGPGSLRELPESWRQRAFDTHEGLSCLRPELGERVAFAQHDLRAGPPDGPFDLVLCRNVAFTYFDQELQDEIASMLVGCLRPGGALVLGTHESLPPATVALTPWPDARAVYRKAPA